MKNSKIKLILKNIDSGTTSLNYLEFFFKKIKEEIERDLNDDEKVELIKILQEEYKVLLRKDKLKKLDNGK